VDIQDLQNVDIQSILKENLTASDQSVLQRISANGIVQIVVSVKLVPEVLRLGHDEPLSGHQG
jgi:hypothetical protein